MKKIFIAVLLIFFAAMPVMAETTDEVYNRAMEEYRTGNYEAALDDFVLVSLLDPSNKTALKYSEEARKQLFAQKGRQLSASEGESRQVTGSKSVKTTSSSKKSAAVEKKLRQASDAYAAGNIPLAIRLWVDVLVIESDEPEATLSINIAKATGKRLEQDRMASLEGIKERTVVTEAVHKKLDTASSYYSTGDIDKAIAAWNQALAAMPDNQEAKRSIQIAELSRRNLEKDRRRMIAEGMQSSQRFVETEGGKDRNKVIDSKMKSAYENYAYGRLGYAIRTWRDVLSIEPGNAEAAQRLDAAIQIEPILKKAKASYKKKDWLKANDGFLRILDIDPECPFARSSVDGIINELKRMIDDESGSREAYYAEGFFFYNQKRYAEAIGSWKKAVALTTGSKRFSLTESEIQDYIARAVAALEREQIKARPPVAAVKPKPQQQKQGAAVAPVAQAKPVVDVDKSNEYYTQGLMLFSEGKYNDAIMAWELALRYNPDNYKATRNIVKTKNILNK
jgi:tetratricopeptide (TPR) repeat protein